MDKNQKRVPIGWFFILLSATQLAACGEQTSTAKPAFVRSGEVIALGGGNAGVKNACVKCHGLKGEGDNTLSPRLAGIGYGYMQRQLDDYANGRRRHAVMSDVAKHLNPEDRAKVSLYYANLTVIVDEFHVVENQNQVLFDQGDIIRGLQACASCHGKFGEGKGAGNPAIARQPAKYIAEQLLAWKRGDRQNDPQHVMLLISQSLTSAEIEQLSVYVSGLPGAYRPPALATFPPERHVDPKNDASMQRLREPG